MNDRDERVLETLRKIVKDDRCPQAERDAAQGRIDAIYAKYGKEALKEEQKQQPRTRTGRSPFDDIFSGAYSNPDFEDLFRDIFGSAFRNSRGFTGASRGFSEQAKQQGKSQNGSEFRYGSAQEKKDAYRNAYDYRTKREQEQREREKTYYREEFERGKKWKWRFGKDPMEPVTETPLRVNFSEPPCTEPQYAYIVGICKAFGFKIPDRNVSFQSASDFLNIWAPRYKDRKWYSMYRELYDDDDFRTYYDPNYGPTID